MRKCLMCHERKVEEYGICEVCKNLNREMAEIHVDLTGYTALVTGGRIKIGYTTTLRMLRDGAKVVVITRYPYDALDRYSNEPDYNEFKQRLIICGFNLMWVNKLEDLLELIHKTVPEGLDILVNNAAQTIKKADAYYAQLESRERQMQALYQDSGSGQLFSLVSGGVQPDYMLIRKENTPAGREESLICPLSSRQVKYLKFSAGDAYI